MGHAGPRAGVLGTAELCGSIIRRAFRPRAREILTDVLQVLVPRVFVSLI